MTTVVTGAAGHVGGNLVRRLIELGRPVRAVVHNDTRALEGLPVERVQADLADVESLKRAFEGAQTVFHLAIKIAIADEPWDLIYNTNVIGPRNVTRACLACGVKRLVHFSSIHAFSQEPLDAPLDETREQVDEKKSLFYDRSKMLGEREVQAAVKEGLNAVICNPTAVMGPYDFKPSAMGEVLLKLYQRRIPSLVAGGFDWVDVRDVVAGALLAEQKGRTGERYLLSGKWLSFADLARLWAEICGVPAPRTVVPMALARFGAPFVSAFSRLTGTRALYTSDSLAALRGHRDIRHDKAAKELGYPEPRPLAETLRDAYAWFKEAGMLSGEKA